MSPKQPELLKDRKDRAGTVWMERSFHLDAWTSVADDGALPAAPIIVSKKRWVAQSALLRATGYPTGLLLEPADTLSDLAADIPHFGVIALHFPKFSDGRPFSLARWLREKFGYGGELRATGHVLHDQIPLMRRVGFDSFVVTHAPTRRALEAGRLSEVDLFYQPAVRHEQRAGRRPWLRRAS